ncbi:Acetyl xylan esterase [Mycena venus]|uniref:Acetyl xylan esterase n=1 Tax=Mycena venus TaxID=2733690 RepID=A0A8H7CJZ2_9AGAR|nr:Acetyl xylan esterase [Mycena venus]
MRIRLAGIVALIACNALEVRAYDNEHHEYWLASWARPAAKRAVIPSLKAEIDAAIANTAHLPHYFWTGLLPPFSGRADSVEPRARDSARRLGGTTLEDTLVGINMPTWAQQDQDSQDTWVYASQAYANASRGVAYVFRGEQVRPTNVFDTLEFPSLVANPAVTGIYQINVHLADEDQPFLLWPTQTPATAETLLEYNVAVSCSIYSRNGLWQHQRTSTTTNFGTWTRYGFFYGGQSSTANPGAFTYSIAPQTVSSRPSQATMASWIASHQSFDAQFPTSTAWAPTSINYGNGWLPYATACPYGADIGKMGGLKIRGLPAGDSITFGFQSSTGNGYRYNLQQVIMSPPWDGGLLPRQSADTVVDFIGSVDSGTMPDPDNEGHSGAEIAAIGGFLMPDLSQNPNVIFLLAGTNDINNDDDIANAPARLMAVVDNITSTLPNATLLVGTIPLNGDPTKEQWSDTFNYNIIQMLLRRASDGARVMPVPMESLGPEDMADSLHPNDQGYAKMADAWFSALWQAAEWGWIDPATGDLSDGSGKQFCSSNPVWYPQGEIANGAGLGPNGGLYDCTLLEEAPTECDCQFTEPNKPVQVFSLPASGQCSDLNDNSTAVRFADLNGDGRAEYLWLDTKGVTTAFLNLGSTQTGINAGQVQWLPSGVIATGVGAARHQVHFADLNGDGRAEYLWVHDDGSVDAWLNLGGPDNGPNAAKVAWHPAGTIATGIGKDGAGVRFADLNGDGRAEYLYLDENGAMTAYLNLGSSDSGLGAANVGWLPQGVVATGPANGATRDNVILADVNGDGRADYLTVTHTGGVAELFINGGGPDNGPNAAKVVWFPQGVIATGVGSSGVGVQFADLNGDGRAEYLDVNYQTSAVNAWLNGCP